MGQRGEIFGDLLLKPTQDVGHDMGEIIGEKVGDGRVRGGGELLAPRPLSSFDTLSNINLPSAVSMRRDESNQVKNRRKHERIQKLIFLFTLILCYRSTLTNINL